LWLALGWIVGSTTEDTKPAWKRRRHHRGDW
jgi:hypothetical protein